MLPFGIDRRLFKFKRVHVIVSIRSSKSIGPVKTQPFPDSLDEEIIDVGLLYFFFFSFVAVGSGLLEFRSGN